LKHRLSQCLWLCFACILRIGQSNLKAIFASIFRWDMYLFRVSSGPYEKLKDCWVRHAKWALKLYTNSWWVWRGNEPFMDNGYPVMKLHRMLLFCNGGRIAPHCGECALFSANAHSVNFMAFTIKWIQYSFLPFLFYALFCKARTRFTAIIINFRLIFKSISVFNSMKELFPLFAFKKQLLFY
jgi:hypothetical protein